MAAGFTNAEDLQGLLSHLFKSVLDKSKQDLVHACMRDLGADKTTKYCSTIAEVMTTEL